MKILIVIAIISFQTSCYYQKKISKLEVNLISNTYFDTFFLIKGVMPYQNENIVDSAISVNGKITMKFKLDEANYFILRSSISKGVNITSFIASPGKKVEFNWNIDSPSKSSVTFTKSNMNKLLYNEVSIPSKFAITNLNASFDSLYGSNRKLDSTEKVMFSNENKFWSDSLDNIYQNYIRNHPKEYGALFFLNLYHRKFSDQFIADLLNRLPNKLKNHSLAKDIAFKKFTIAKINNFSQFSLIDSLGNLFDYSAYNNTIVLVDFWASWCKPCLENIPIVDSLRKKFQNQDFKVLGISIDENRESWLKALRREKLPWDNLLEPKALKGTTSIYFNISTIPRYVLLGKNGIIINKDLQLKSAEQEISKALSLINK